MQKQLHTRASYRSRRRWFSPPALMGIIVLAILVLVAGVGFATTQVSASYAASAKHHHKHRHKHKQQQQQQVSRCTLSVPANPLSAQGLATPYQLGGGCKEANPMQAAFVQGAVIDPATGQISIYNPLVIDQGTQPAIQPFMPQLPANGIVALWFGFNGNTLILQDTNGSLAEGQCVNGVAGSIFGQVSYCNAPAFFAAANRAMQAGKLIVPALGTGRDGMACPTVRDFSVVDQDQSDNVTADYLVTRTGRTAQLTTANVGALPNATRAANGSDNRLLDSFIDAALGCTPWMAPDLADPGHLVPAQPLNELQAAARQTAPVALVPGRDPMVLNNNRPDLAKVTAYRAGVDQPAATANNARTTTYCQNLLKVAPQRMVLDAPFTGKTASPDPAAANTLFTFMAQRFQATFEGPLGTGLQCTAAGNGPVQVQKDANGVAISATITVNGQTRCFMSDGTVDPTGKTCMQAMNMKGNNGNGNGMTQQQGQQRQGRHGQHRKHRHR